MSNNQLACSTLCFKDSGIVGAIKKISDLKFKNIEICHVPGFCEHLNDLSADAINNIKNIVVELKIKIFAITVYPGFFNNEFPEDIYKNVKRFIDAGNKLGIKYLTIPSGVPVDKDVRNDAQNNIGKYLKKAADYAEKRGIVISVEAPHWRTFTESVEEAKSLLRTIDNRIKCTLDTSHVCRGGDSDVVSGIKEIGIERVSYFHARDVYKKEIFLTPGRGQIDFKKMIDYLRSESFKGLISLELEDETLKEAKVLKEILFAKKMFHELLDGRLSFSNKIKILTISKSLIRFINNPKLELKRHGFITRFPLISVAKKLKNFLKGFQTKTIFDGHWKKQKKGMSYVVDFEKLGLIKGQISKEGQIKVCIQGCGSAGVLHAFGFSRLENVRVVGISDVNVELADDLAGKLHCNSYNSLQNMIEFESPDIISICTREWQHYDSMKQIIPQKIDIFCEKIFVTKYDHAKEIAENINNHKNYIGFNYNYRFFPGIRRIKSIIESKELGDLSSIHFKVHAYSYHHALDLIGFLGGKIISVHGSFSNDDSLRDFGGTDWRLYDEDILYLPSRNIGIFFKMEKEVIISLESSIFYSPQEFILSVDCTFTEGMLALKGINTSDVFGSLSYSSLKNKKLSIKMAEDHILGKGYNYAFSKSIESFLHAYRNKIQPESGLEDGILNIKLEKAISKSNKLNRGVKLNEN